MKGMRRNKRPVFVALVLMIILVIAAFVYSKKMIVRPSYNNNTDTATADEQYQEKSNTLKTELLSEKDTDNDGLKDWQEVLWNTDPNNPDTDGDGTPDGVEVQEGRDPRVPGPNDKLTLTQNTSTTSTATSNQNDQTLTETDLVAQTIFSKYLALSGQDGTMDQDTMNTMVQNLVQSAPFQPQYKAYSLNDLNIKTNNDNSVHDNTVEIRTYGNTIEQIAKKYSPPEPKGELEIVYESMLNSNQSEISNLDPIITGYQNILKAELAVPVPESAAGLHLSFVNSISEVLYNIQGMRKLFTDPVLALSGVTNYENSGTDLGNSMDALGKYFIQQGVIFTPEEAGYPLTAGQ